MGFFNTIRCEYLLPEPRHQDLEYQSKSLGSMMVHYTHHC